jgi:CRP/FNR family transcriptional regulator, anaerobic regulatory protein
MPYQSFIDFINTSLHFPPQEIDLIKGCFKHKQFKKNTFLEKESSVAKNLYFIINGFVRVYQVEDSIEVTTNIIGKNQLATAFYSFVYSVRSAENIRCITDCDMLFISKNDYDFLYENSEGWRVFCKGTYEKIIKSQQERTKKLLTLSSEERYLDLLKHQPDLIQQVPVQYISSYIGIKPESLSRIRRKIIS